MGTKRNWAPEDKLATFLGIFSIITLILGCLNPLEPKDVYNSVKDARNMLQKGEVPEANQKTTQTGGILLQKVIHGIDLHYFGIQLRKHA